METSKTPNWWSGLRRVDQPSTRNVLNLQAAAWLTLLLVALVVMLPSELLAQSPWESSANKLQTAFTGTIAKALSLVAIVVGGLMFAYGEGSGKKAIAGIVFGVGMAVGAMSFMSWLFGG